MFVFQESLFNEIIDLFLSYEPNKLPVGTQHVGIEIPPKYFQKQIFKFKYIPIYIDFSLLFPLITFDFLVPVWSWSWGAPHSFVAALLFQVFFMWNDEFIVPLCLLIAACIVSGRVGYFWIQMTTCKGTGDSEKMTWEIWKTAATLQAVGVHTPKQRQQKLICLLWSFVDSFVNKT